MLHDAGELAHFREIGLPLVCNDPLVLRRTDLLMPSLPPLCSRSHYAAELSSPQSPDSDPSALGFPFRRSPFAAALLESALDELSRIRESLAEEAAPAATKVENLRKVAASAGACAASADELHRASKGLATLASQLKCSPKAGRHAAALASAAATIKRTAMECLPRIICLHGSTQSADIFCDRLKTLQKKLRGAASMHFVDAPHQVEGTEGGTPSLCWWQRGAQRGMPHPGWSAQWEASLSSLCGALRDAAAAGRPFDGVLGFSNGAAAAAMLLAEIARNARDAPQLSFALLSAGYLPAALAPSPSKEAPVLAIPSLHLVGIADDQVTPAQAAELQQIFEAPALLVHEQGHVVPQRARDSDTIAQWIRCQASLPSAAPVTSTSRG